MSRDGKTFKIIIMLLLGIIIIILSNQISASTTIYVDDLPGSGPGNPAENYTNIQDAINNANPDDTIFVYNGTYNEHININKKLNLTGENKNATIIDGSSSGSVVNLNFNYINLSGFTIQNSGSSSTNAGIYNNKKNNCNIYNLIIKNNNNHGVYIIDADTTIANLNVCYNNKIGIYYEFTKGSNNKYPQIKDSLIYNNSQDGIRIKANILYEWGGITRSYYPTIANTTVWNNTINGMYFHSHAEGNGLMPYVMYSHLYVTVKNCDIENCKNGIETHRTHGAKGTSYLYLTIQKTNNSDNEEYGIKLDNIAINENQTQVTNNGKFDWYGNAYSYGNWSWYKQSRYNFTGTVTINSDHVLMVNPGTHILFGDSDSELVITGKIIANGLLTDTILITSNINPKSPGQWKGIRLDEAKTGCQFQHIQISYAQNGIATYRTNIYCNYLKINNCLENGLFIDFSSLNLSNSNIDNCVNGVKIKNTAVDDDDVYRIININNSEITHNNVNGINTSLYLSYGGTSVYANYYAKYKFKIENTKLTNNNDIGLLFDIYGYRWAMGTVIINLDFNLINCNISNNTIGLKTDFDEKGNAIVDYSYIMNHCIIKSNNIGSFFDTSEEGNIISNCSFIENSQGLKLNKYCLHTLIYHNNFVNNAIQANDAGINDWNNSYPTGGNYWSDFDEPSEGAFDNYNGPLQDMPGGDGIVDGGSLNPYAISGADNQDIYPLIKKIDTEPITTNNIPLLAWYPNVNVPNHQIYMNVTNGTNSYFSINLTNISAGYHISNGIYNGWCFEKEVIMTREQWHPVKLCHSYDPNLPEVFKNINWSMINYVINAKDDLKKEEIQEVIWSYINGIEPKTSTSKTLLEKAAQESISFTPTIGDKVAILVYLDPEADLPNDYPPVQNTFIELPLTYTSCNLSYWLNNKDTWPSMIEPDDLVGEYFNLPYYNELEIMNLSNIIENDFNSNIPLIVKIFYGELLKQAIIGLLNTNHPCIEYPITHDQIIVSVHEAFTNIAKTAFISMVFEVYNNIGCNCNIVSTCCPCCN